MKKTTNILVSWKKSNITKIWTLIALTLSALLVLGLGLWLKPRFSEKTAEASNLIALPENQRLLDAATVNTIQASNDLPVKTTTTVEESEEEPSPATQTGPVTQHVNGIEVVANNLRRSSHGVEVDMCYPLPDTSDWLLENVTLRYGDTEISDYYGELIEIKEASPQGEAGYRCDRLSFDVPSHADLSEITLTVDSFSAYPREGEYCSAPFVGRVQEALAEDGITVECLTEEWGETLAIAGKPETLSQATAEEILNAKLVPIVNESLETKGPWVFSFSLDE